MTVLKWHIAGLTAALLSLAAPVALAQSQSCAADAEQRARKLIRFHLADPGMEEQIADGKTARKVADAPLLTGRGKLDVFEVTTNVYKSSYRMRFLYAQIPGSCALLGQEILEASNPY